MAEKRIQHGSYTCPYCGSRHTWQGYFDEVYEEWHCVDCSKVWTDVYRRKYIETIIDVEED